MSSTKRLRNIHGQCLEHPQVQIRTIDDISKGDHLLFRRFSRLGLYDHHVIVLNVHKEEGELTIANFAGHVAEKRKPHVLTTRQKFAEVKNCVYKVEYGEKEAFKTDEVLKRAIRFCNSANQRADQAERVLPYNLATNNCEHLAYYCKAGYRKSTQVKNFTRMAGGLTATMFKDVVRGCLAGTKLVRTFGVVATVAIEAVLTSDDVYRYYQMWERKAISEAEFYDMVVMRVVAAVASITGTSSGAAAGLVIAGPVGMVIGGLLGAIFGKLAGRALGESPVVADITDTVLKALKSYKLHTA